MTLPSCLCPHVIEIADFSTFLRRGHSCRFDTSRFLLYSCVMVKINNHPVHLLHFSLDQRNLHDIFGLQFDSEETPT